jgi:uncharacterized membrane protein YhaH (DUF805 family)
MSLPIIYEHEGFPVELVTVDDVRRGIQSGRLKRETLVQTWQGEARTRTCRAEEVEFLRPYFATETGEATAIDEPTAVSCGPAVEQQLDGSERPLITLSPSSWHPATPPNWHEHRLHRLEGGVPTYDRSATGGRFWRNALAPILRYAEFNGRSLRGEFWSFQLVQWIGLIILTPSPTLLAVAILGLVIPNVAVTIRRLHDMNVTGWIALIIVIPYLGLCALLILMLLNGTSGSNRFGHDPRVPREFRF